MKKNSKEIHGNINGGSPGSGSMGRGVFLPLTSLCFPSSIHKPQVFLESGGMNGAQRRRV